PPRSIGPATKGTQELMMPDEKRPGMKPKLPSLDEAVGSVEGEVEVEEERFGDAPGMVDHVKEKMRSQRPWTLNKAGWGSTKKSSLMPQGVGEVEKERGIRKKEDSQEGDGVTQQTLSVILKLMEGMRKIQDRMSKGSSHDPDQEPETVRQSVDLPKLPEWQGESAPIDFSDWLVVLASLMADLTPTSEERWSLTLEEARSWYQKHLLKSPLDRLTHQIAPSAKLTLRKWARLEKRAAALLLSAVPESLREEVVSSRSLSTFGILVKGMIAYQPGSLSERQAILGHDLAQMAEVEK
ncbi:unnamed protein product, partial [Durusdinium trenchii]